MTRATGEVLKWSSPPPVPSQCPPLFPMGQGETGLRAHSPDPHKGAWKSETGLPGEQAPKSLLQTCPPHHSWIAPWTVLFPNFWHSKRNPASELSTLSPEELHCSGSVTSTGSKLGQVLLPASRSWPALTAQWPGHVLAAPGEREPGNCWRRGIGAGVSGAGGGGEGLTPRSVQVVVLPLLHSQE